MRDTAGEVGTNTSDDQLERTYNSSVPIQYVPLKTYRKRLTIEKGDGRGSGISLLMARHDDYYEAGLNTENLLHYTGCKSRPKTRIYAPIYPYLVWKCTRAIGNENKLSPDFKLGLSVSFPMTITIWLVTPPLYNANHFRKDKFE